MSSFSKKNLNYTKNGVYNYSLSHIIIPVTQCFPTFFKAGLNNPTEYETVGLDLSRINPSFDYETVIQVTAGASTYENAGMAGNIQSRNLEYEMVKQGEGNAEFC